MNKKAIYLEGQGEVIFLIHLIQLAHEYSGIVVQTECLCYNNPNTRRRIKNNGLYQIGGEFSEYCHNYLILLVEGDNNVNSFMRDRAEGQLAQGFECIIGLRDVYSEHFKNEIASPNASWFTDGTLNEYLENQRTAIACDDKVQLHFSIMELEAWLLALNRIAFPGTYLYANPVQAILHPAKELGIHYQSATGNKYDKSESTMLSIKSHYTQDHIDSLISSNECPDFNEFYMKLFE